MCACARQSKCRLRQVHPTHESHAHAHGSEPHLRLGKNKFRKERESMRYDQLPLQLTWRKCSENPAKLRYIFVCTSLGAYPGIYLGSYSGRLNTKLPGLDKSLDLAQDGARLGGTLET